MRCGLMLHRFVSVCFPSNIIEIIEYVFYRWKTVTCGVLFLKFLTNKQ